MENKNAFKHWINEEVVVKIAKSIQANHPEFDSKAFKALSSKLTNLELKARVLEITAGLKRHLPEDYPTSVKILVQAMKDSDLKGFNLWPFSEYISQFGVNHMEHSMSAMEVLTEKFTSEFAIRPFLLKDAKRVLQYLHQKTNHPNVHIRRWVSEGTRPYLPWGAKIPQVADNPEWTLKLLEKLKHDEELYVRKSVANHLNDHSKKHAALVVRTLERWEKESSEKHLSKIQWIKHRALRTLIKKGDAKALKLMGVDQKMKIKVGKIQLNKKNFKLNDKLEFEFEVKSLAKKNQKLIIDYGIDFLKSNGKHNTKVFKLKTITLGPDERLIVKKAHSLKRITTMKYYSGAHLLSIQINGNQMLQIPWTFKC